MQLITIVFLFMIFPASASAYFDPGTGSLIIQVLIGGLAAITVFWGRLKLYVRSLLLSTRPDKTSPDTDDTEGQESNNSHSAD